MKTNFEKLDLVSQTAIESKVSVTPISELEESHKEELARREIDKRPMSLSDWVLIILVVFFLFALVVYPVLCLDNLRSNVNNIGKTYCENNGDDFVSVDYHYLYTQTTITCKTQNKSIYQINIK